MMSGYVLEFDDTQVMQALQELLHRTGTVEPALREMGEQLKRTTHERFGTQTAPDGTPWADTKDSTKARKTRNPDKILIETGTLMNDTISHDASANELLFGSSAIQAAVMQNGASQGAFGQSSRGGPLPWGDIPARPFIGVSTEDQDAFMDILRNYLLG